jgi:predicted DNA-binding protein (UPF0251 family)
MTTTRRKKVEPPPQFTEMQHGAVTLRALAKWPTYFSGNDGHIYSVKNGVVRRLELIRNRQLKYPTVTLYHDSIRYPRRHRGGKTYMCKRPTPQYVHVLVASVWLPPRPSPEHTIDHENENKFDNRPGNLRWLTGEDNTFAYYRNHPLVVSGEKNGNAKLSDAEAVRLLDLRGKMTQRMAADMFGCSETTVGRIWKGTGWRHLHGVVFGQS